MKNKVMVYVLLSVMVIWSGLYAPITVEASESSFNLNQSTNDKIVLRADVIETIFRVHHGKRQYRRWNKTRGKWVDPAWIDL